MSSFGDQRDAIKVIAAACSVCFTGLLVLSIVMRTVWIPQGIRRERMMSCSSNRRYIAEQEKLYKQNSSAYQYTTSLKQLKIPLTYTTCPEDGVYSVVIQNNQVQIRCSIKDHDAVVVKE